MPCLPTVYKWMRERPTFAANYARARLDQADTYADESVEIADTPQIGVKVKTGPNGIETTTADMTEHRKLRIDTRKWFASVTNPKYRQKVDTRLIAQMMPAPDTSSMISDDDAAMSYRALLPMPVRNDV